MADYDVPFLVGSVDLLRKKRWSHMGEHQYADHGAMRNGMPMSGTIGWNRYEHGCPSYYVLRCEKEMMPQVADDLEWRGFVPSGTPFIDLGPGTLEAVIQKSLLLVRALRSGIYVPIDMSVTFCSQAGGVIQKELPDTLITSSVENFFSDNAEPALDFPALGFLGGITIANIEAPISKVRPKAQLIQGLKNLAKITGGGWLMLSTDANQNGTENKAMYSENGLFEINTFDRMAHELPFEGLEPDGFIYDPFWVPESSQLAHTALATRNMRVRVKSSYFDGAIDIAKNDRFHLKNSFKYPDEFLIQCAREAGFTVLEMWIHGEKPMRVWLLKATPMELPLRLDQGIKAPQPRHILQREYAIK